MKIKNITYTLFTLIIGAMLQACVNDFGECPEEAAPGIVTFRFNLNLGDMGHITRADGVWNPSGESDAGNEFDNTIKVIETDGKGVVKWLHVMLINSAGDLLHVNIESGFQLNDKEGGYDVIASLDFSDPKVREKWPAGEYKVMVLANFRDRTYEENDTHFSKYDKFSDLKEKINSIGADWLNDDTSRNSNNVPAIPMWGMTTARFNFDGVSTQTFDIDLLRAVAKVKLILTPTLKEAGYKIVKCSVDKLNKKIYNMPSGWDTAKKTSDTNQPHYDAAFHPNPGKKLTNKVVDKSEADDKDGSLVFYLPEWEASSKDDCTVLTAEVYDDLGNIESCEMTISNESLGLGNYHNDIHNVNRNHLYQFTLDKDINEGALSYKLECWNLQQSAIGWNPPSWTLKSSDSEAIWGYVSFPSYSSSDSEDLIQATTSYADYEFILTEPAGAVWKAFLVEDDREYTAEDKHTANDDGTINYNPPANTPNGFFFGVGNDDKNNNKAASTGIARSKAYNIKVGTRLQTTNFDENKQPFTMDDNESIVKLNEAGIYWKNKEKVPTCYLVIKIAYDGKNFSECLKINPAFVFAGDEKRIQIRLLPQFYKSKSNHNNERHVKGIKNKNEFPDYLEYTWWGYPMGKEASEEDNSDSGSDQETSPTE